ncbi:carbohydrate sulfotransferase 15-like isoform X3 [Mizuhopecten yessoensis]|uniref:Carbohydrate sulfotransferase 15 n=1 Tax=Mizuhopecten yessoensis TaxID=6573 RepID=A0A210PTX7_MIZYE|nr:carbohydrate sulfotransferase 15-like isoform X3 [Mizuhopecten yessoensis]OWF39912.1 Carbohydrate sulfotransferase 15 [Mizuhopecten yessoensis]
MERRVLNSVTACGILLCLVVYLYTYNFYTGISRPLPDIRPILSHRMILDASAEDNYHQKYVCSNQTHRNKVEDILCMTPPNFLDNYQNPCWKERGNGSGETSLKCLPYFHIIGAAKAGTTDLFSRITMHPSIMKVDGFLQKETFYWSWRRYGKCEVSLRYCENFLTFNQFLSFFKSDKISLVRDAKMSYFLNGEIGSSSANLIRRNKENYHHMITGHADPMDLWGMYYWKDIPQNNATLSEPVYTTPHLIHHINPALKLIVILREPSERTYSHYLFRRLGNSAREFHHHAVGNFTLLNTCVKNVGSMRACLFNESLLEHYKRFPIHGSFYSILLKEWFSVFPREQFLIMRTEDYSSNMTSHLRKIFNFLEVDDITETELNNMSRVPVRRITKHKKAIGNMLPETKLFLYKIFQPYTQELADILHDKRFLWEENSIISS